ncbi:uncharacterized protein LOC135218738 [Macrobrachium nipponense]|uniref:uncharacterized protein LOC135218738 n=1 Tax=Macrobrachium nipponense TaxID=159736 RepID=UPI0030C839FB
MAITSENARINISGECLNNLRFADDSESGEGLQKIKEDLNRESRNVGLKTNMSKSKINSMKMQRQQIRVMDEPLEIVNEYTYLGQTVSVSPGHETEIKRRIGMGWRAFVVTYPTFTCTSLTLVTLEIIDQVNEPHTISKSLAAPSIQFSTFAPHHSTQKQGILRGRRFSSQKRSPH